MGRSARRRRNKAGRNGDSGRTGSNSSLAGAQSQNVLVSLTETNNADEDLNPHLTERFNRHLHLQSGSTSNDNMPHSMPQKINNDIHDYFELAKRPTVGGPWLEKPELPLPSEIMASQSYISKDDTDGLIEVAESVRPHKVDGPYEGREEYLSTKYELLREDAIHPLREAVGQVRLDPYKDEAEYSGHAIGIYDPVYITALTFSPRGIATKVAFSLSRVKKRINWGQSKRLITGSLVALTPCDDAFQTRCILATVAARPLPALEQNPPEIDLFFARPEEQEIDPMQKWIMVESRDAFFEASRHTLTALQHLMKEPFPMEKYLVQLQEKIDTPARIQNNSYVNLSSLVNAEEREVYQNIDILQEWPLTSSHSLDKSQSKALQRMLTKELAIVQGPPGTGKTTVSVKALNIILDNSREGDVPVIVTAQTNHAVDQILRHIALFESNYIRLGGRSRDEEIKKRTLFQVRSKAPPKKEPGSAKAQAYNALRRISKDCRMLLAPLEANKQPLDHKVLQKLKLLTESQADSLERESQCAIGISSRDSPGILMEQWLGRFLTPCHRPMIPDDYGWGFEEEDFEVEQLQELEAEAVAQDDDEIDSLRGPVVLLCDNYIGKGGTRMSTANIQDLLEATDDLTILRPEERPTIYNYFLCEVKKKIAKEVRKVAKEYANAVLQRKIGAWEEDLQFLQSARIIGCTTTGLSKYRALLSALRPRICLVEEAAETLEALVTAACFPSLEQLLLVGDHQQLRPHTQVRAFEDAPYYLNVSLFERLVWNNVEYETLRSQRRMIPEVRRLLTPIYGNTLKDHPSVKDASIRPPVEGMGGNNSFFFHHLWPEERDANMSAFNEKEASMVLGLVDYLILNGTEPDKITILTYYNGQRKFILTQLRGHHNLRLHSSAIRVATIDSYQGEENEIVMLSLVRSNKRGAIGFLSCENRACVALSRAKRGFYIFGNAEMLAIANDTWAAVVEIMYGKKTKTKVAEGQERRVGFHLPLECTKHGRKMWIQQPDDWELIHGGCDKMCGGTLPCEHRCPYRCHPFRHDQLNCTQKCSKRLDICGHPCIAMCCDPCRCQICEQRNNGMKSMLKPPKKNAVPSGVTKIGVHDVLPSGGNQRGSLIPEKNRNSTPVADPASASSASLFDTSPQKPLAAKNVGRLIDIDFDPGWQPSPGGSGQHTSTHTANRSWSLGGHDEETIGDLMW